jgi:hypothetical protein
VAIVTPSGKKFTTNGQTVAALQRIHISTVNCAECEQPATVFHGGVPLCGTCFYKRTLGESTNLSDPATHDVWQRLNEAVAALEAIVTKISGEIDELSKKR